MVWCYRLHKHKAYKMVISRSTENELPTFSIIEYSFYYRFRAELENIPSPASQMLRFDALKMSSWTFSLFSDIL